MKHELPKLEYEYDALEPFVDAKTMEIHHSKHHQTYVDKLNAALENNSDLQEKEIEDLIKDLDEVPSEIRDMVRNHGGGHLNHSFFWLLLKKGVPFEGEVAEKIKEKFGSFLEFKEKFTEAALKLFGSGWVWLVLDNGELKIMSTANQDSPLSEGKIPILALDVWEHAYYLKYFNKRDEYVNAFFNVINWGKVNENFKGG